MLAAAVTTEELPRVMAMNASVWQFGTIAGPIAAGLLHLAGAPAPFVVAAIAAGLGAGFVLLVADGDRARAPVRASAHSATLADALEGVRFILRTPALLGAMSLDLVAVLLGGATALLPVFSQDVLHVGALGNGVLRAAPGVGRRRGRARAHGPPAQAAGRADAVRRRRRVRRLHARVRALAQLPALAARRSPASRPPTC